MGGTRDGSDGGRPLTIDGSRWLWVARWGTGVALVGSALAFWVVWQRSAGPPFTTTETYTVAGLLAVNAAAWWYQALYLFVHTERALEHGVAVLGVTRLPLSRLGSGRFDEHLGRDHVWAVGAARLFVIVAIAGVLTLALSGFVLPT